MMFYICPGINRHSEVIGVGRDIVFSSIDIEYLLMFLKKPIVLTQTK